MSEAITSKQNPFCKHLKKLRTNRAYRCEHGEFLADGVKLVGEALRWATVKAVVCREDVRLEGVPESVRVITVSRAVMQDISRMDTPQGAIAVCAMPAQVPLDLRPGCLILDGIQDPGNLGTILRTADAFDIPVALSSGCADPYGEKCVRASMGAVLRTPPMQAQTEEILEACRRNSVPLCVTALRDTAKDIRTLALARFAVVIGSEGQGVQQAFLDAAAEAAIIPMTPRCESLNAAISAGIVLWELANQAQRP